MDGVLVHSLVIYMFLLLDIVLTSNFKNNLLGSCIQKIILNYICRIQSAIVILGGTNITNPTQAGQVRLFTSLLSWHENYDGDNLAYDIGLVRFTSPVIFSDVLFPIRLPNLRQVSSTFAGQEGTSIGWGETTNSN